MDRYSPNRAFASRLALVVSPKAALPDMFLQTLDSLAVRVRQDDPRAGLSDDGMGTPDLLILCPDGPDDMAALVPLADRANQIHCPVIFMASLDLIDWVPDPLWHGCQSILVDPDTGDFAASVALALSAQPGLLSDISRDMDAARLQRLADEVGRIARTLASLSAAAPLGSPNLSDMRDSFAGEPVAGEAALSARHIRGIIRLRRLRDRYFDTHLFADPAWDMLLDLMAARLERVQVAVSSLCIASCVPSTTALRWIKMMTHSGVFERTCDPADRRRVFIHLSEAAAQSMTRLLTDVAVSGDCLI
jgi:hypothetical protein